MPMLCDNQHAPSAQPLSGTCTGDSSATPWRAVMTCSAIRGLSPMPSVFWITRPNNAN
jgi:hypothetical protein